MNDNCSLCLYKIKCYPGETRYTTFKTCKDYKPDRERIERRIECVERQSKKEKFTYGWGWSDEKCLVLNTADFPTVSSTIREGLLKMLKEAEEFEASMGLLEETGDKHD